MIWKEGREIWQDRGKGFIARRLGGSTVVSRYFLHHVTGYCKKITNLHSFTYDQKYQLSQIKVSLRKHSVIFFLLKASALWVDAFNKSKCPYVCVSVCLSVCSLLRYRLTVFLAPLPKVGCQIFFRDSESLGKSNWKKWSIIWTFLFGSGLKSPRKKKGFFCWFCLTKHGGNHTSQWIRDLWSKGVSLILAYF